jgi:hypothetical protein
MLRREVSHLVKWSNLAKHKELGRWGIKNLVWFCHALDTKSMWRLMHNEMLWGRVMTVKYIHGMSIVEWLRQPTKTTQNSSICWTALVEVFMLIEEHML